MDGTGGILESRRCRSLDDRLRNDETEERADGRLGGLVSFLRLDFVVSLSSAVTRGCRARSLSPSRESIDGDLEAARSGTAIDSAASRPARLAGDQLCFLSKRFSSLAGDEDRDGIHDFLAKLRRVPVMDRLSLLSFDSD